MFPPSFLFSLATVVSILLTFYKRNNIWIHWCSLLFFCFQFHCLCYEAHFLLSVCFGLICSFYSWLVKYKFKLLTQVRPFFYTFISILCYIFPSMQYFRCIWQMLYAVFSILFNSKCILLSLEFLSWTHVIFKSVVLSKY